jgi:hypothetical protein
MARTLGRDAAGCIGMASELPRAIARDIGSLLDELGTLGLRVTDSRYDPDAFGNYLVDLDSPLGWLRIVCERRQYILHGPSREVLEGAGLWRAFDSKDEFATALLRWLRTRAA